MTDPVSTKLSRATKRKLAEREVLATLRKLGKHPGLNLVVECVAELARDPFENPAAREAWSLLEGALAVGLDP